MQIRTVEYRRVREAAQVLAQAYESEPIIERMIPSGVFERDRKITDFFVWSMLMTGLDTVDVAIDPFTDRVVGVALWEPPGHQPHTLMAVSAYPGMYLGVGKEGLETLEQFDGASEGCHPDEPFWHLVDIGTAPQARGLGVGAELLRHRLRMIDEEGALASLEATTEASAKLYERLGFTERHRLEGVAEGVCVMWREPQEKAAA